MATQYLFSNDERKLMAALLRRASEEFANHGCNEFDLKELGLERMAPALHAAFRARDPEYPYEGTVFDDWMLMDLLADNLHPEEK